MLTRYVSDGGTVMFSPVTEHTLAEVKAITHRDELALTEPFFHANTCCIKAPVSWMREGTPETLVNYFDGIVLPYPFEPNLSPLLSGIANIDLNWGGQTMFEQGDRAQGHGSSHVRAGTQHADQQLAHLFRAGKKSLWRDAERRTRFASERLVHKP
jgi:hypothetical protein